MGNNRTGANQRIKNICSSKSIDEMTLYAKSKLLLEIYRDICWDTADYAAQIREEAIYDYELCSNDLNAAFLYLENFAPTEKKDRFAARVQSLFEVKWMIEIVDHAVMKVRAFPCTGELYASMLKTVTQYLNQSYLSYRIIERFVELSHRVDSAHPFKAFPSHWLG